MAYQEHFAIPKAASRSKAVDSASQMRPIPGREHEMVSNNAGGMSFTVGTFDRLRRFLILGSDEPTYYVGAKALTLNNIAGVLSALQEDGMRVVQEIVEISESGRAPRNDSALYALAIAASFGVASNQAPGELTALQRALVAGSSEAGAIRDAAFRALPRVARTGTHVMQFAGYLNSLRGWGRSPKKALAAWFIDMDEDKLALQAIKYRQREGWTLRDLLRLAHPKADGRRQVLLDWIAHREISDADTANHEVRKDLDMSFTPRRHALAPARARMLSARHEYPLIEGFYRAQNAETVDEVVTAIRDYELPREGVPDQFLKDASVWAALLPHMPMNALLRNLNKLSACGLLNDRDTARHVAGRLTNEVELRKARVHPFKILLGMHVYKSGAGALGSLTWKPAADVVEALDAAFYAAFRTVEPSGKRFMLGLDVSGSMEGAFLGKSRIINAREASAAMALVTMATEPACSVGGFTHHFEPLKIAPTQRLDRVVKTISGLNFGSTDAAKPIEYALKNDMKVDSFVIYTDNETWSGKQHVTTALQRYRDKTGIYANLIAVGMTATSFSVVDPSDPLQMNVVGFDADTPSFISDFVRG
jgi:60 kDa SS-A/Ro ribonucleoprotein